MSALSQVKPKVGRVPGLPPRVAAPQSRPPFWSMLARNCVRALQESVLRVRIPSPMTFSFVMMGVIVISGGWLLFGTYSRPPHLTQNANVSPGLATAPSSQGGALTGQLVTMGAVRPSPTSTAYERGVEAIPSASASEANPAVDKVDHERLLSILSKD